MTATILGDGNSPATAVPVAAPGSPGQGGTAAAETVSHRFSRTQRTGESDRDYHDCDRRRFPSPGRLGP